MKLYYDCPYIALYMEKHFGIKYGTHDVTKIYIASESLPIFKPMEGDVAEFIGEFDSIYDVIKIDALNRSRPANYTAGEHRFYKIIQRNEIPFFTPKTEE